MDRSKHHQRLAGAFQDVAATLVTIFVEHDVPCSVTAKVAAELDVLFARHLADGRRGSR